MRSYCASLAKVDKSDQVDFIVTQTAKIKMENVGFDGERKIGRNERPVSRLESEMQRSSILSCQTSLMDILNVNGHSCDVVITSEKISWEPLSGSRRTAKVKRSLSVVRTNSNSGSEGWSENCIPMSDVLGANIRRMRKTNQSENQGVCLGFGVYVYRTKDGGTKYVEDVVAFDHPSELVCQKWCLFIQQVVASFKERPRSVKVFLQPFAGKKCSRLVYGTKVQPLFLAAGISPRVTEVNQGGSNIAEVVASMNLSEFDSIICVGGDGTVNRVVSAVLNKVQSDEDIETSHPEFQPKCCPVPVGIIPTGTVNETAFSVMGTDDVFTAVVHIMLGHLQPVDICSVANANRLVSWSFNSHFGFFASLLWYMKKYSVLGEKRIEAAVVKMLSKHKYRPYNCSIQYLPVDDVETNSPLKGVACRQGCVQCISANRISKDPSFNYGEVEDFKDSDSNSSCDSIQAVDSSKQYRSVSGNFLSISLLAMPGLGDLSPLGHSKFTHLQDGCIDLITIEDVERKEFVRYLRRFSNTKNQLDLPFVKSYRCKEVRVVPILNKSWNDSDAASNTVDDAKLEWVTAAAASRGEQRMYGEPVIDVEKQSSDSDSDKSDDDDDDDDDDYETGEQTNNGNEKPTRNSQADDSQGYQTVKIKNRFIGGAIKIRHALINMKSDLLGAESKDIPSSSHSSKSSKQERPLMWNIGMEMYNEVNLQFRVHKGLLKLHGLGIPNAYHPSQLKWPCLSIF